MQLSSRFFYSSFLLVISFSFSLGNEKICNCSPKNLQTKINESDIVALIKVHGYAIGLHGKRYIVDFQNVYKNCSESNSIFNNELWMLLENCHVQLELNQEYIVGIKIHSGKPVISICDLYILVNNITKMDFEIITQEHCHTHDIKRRSIVDNSILDNSMVSTISSITTIETTTQSAILLNKIKNELPSFTTEMGLTTTEEPKAESTQVINEEAGAKLFTENSTPVPLDLATQLINHERSQLPNEATTQLTNEKTTQLTYSDKETTTEFINEATTQSTNKETTTQLTSEETTTQSTNEETTTQFVNKEATTEFINEATTQSTIEETTTQLVNKEATTEFINEATTQSTNEETTWTPLVTQNLTTEIIIDETTVVPLDTTTQTTNGYTTTVPIDVTQSINRESTAVPTISSTESSNRETTMLPLISSTESPNKLTTFVPLPLKPFFIDELKRKYFLAQVSEYWKNLQDSYRKNQYTNCDSHNQQKQQNPCFILKYWFNF